jgi:hypothetical protein
MGTEVESGARCNGYGAPVESDSVTVHRITGVYRWAPLWLYLWILPIGAFGVVVVIARGDATGIGFMAACLPLAVWTVVMELRMPRRIEADRGGLRFVARARTIEVAWSDITAVRPPVGGGRTDSLEWHWDGGKVVTHTQFTGSGDLFAVLRERNPDADVRVSWEGQPGGRKARPPW